MGSYRTIWYITDTRLELTFEVKVQEAQAVLAIKNVATVTGENISTPVKPEEVVYVYPQSPPVKNGSKHFDNLQT